MTSEAGGPRFILGAGDLGLDELRDRDSVVPIYRRESHAVVIFLLGSRVIAQHHAATGADLPAIIERENQADSGTRRGVLVGDQAHTAFTQVHHGPLMAPAIVFQRERRGQ